MTTGNATISNNTIGATSGTGSIYTVCTTSGGVVTGIYAAGANTLTIQNNTVGAIMTIPRIEGGHFAEWIRACKGGPAAGSDFAYASKLTELCLLSNVAVRARRPIDWDAAAMKVTNLPYANQYLTKEYRPGFGV